MADDTRVDWYAARIKWASDIKMAGRDAAGNQSAIVLRCLADATTMASAGVTNRPARRAFVESMSLQLMSRRSTASPRLISSADARKAVAEF